ncbi:MAG: PAS domain S-box protein [Gemmatimonadota bacterium]
MPTSTTEEIRRAEALHRLQLFDAPPDPALDGLTATAATLLGAPAARVTFDDANRHRVKSTAGAATSAMVVVSETPLTSAAGDVIGLLTVLDRTHREISGTQQDALREIASAMMTHLELRVQRRETAQMERTLLTTLAQQQETEQTLRSREHRYRMLFAQNPTPMWVYDVETLRFLAVNASALAHYGYTETEFLARSIVDIRDPEDVPALLRAVEGVRRGAPDVTVTRHRLKDGTRIDVEVAGDALLFDGHAARLVVVRDITARLLADQRRRESDERYEMVMRGAAAGIWDWNIATGEVFYSLRYKALLGYSDAEFANSVAAFHEVMHPDDQADYTRALNAHLTSPGTLFDTELRLRARSGEYRWVHYRGQAVWDDRGKAHRMAGSVIDVTDRRHAVDAMRESEERFRLLSRATNDAIWDWDMETDTVWWNDGYYALFGYTRLDTPVGIASWKHRIVEADRERVETSIQQAIDSGAESWWGEYRFTRADGTHAYVLDRGYVIRDAAGHATRMIGGMTDLTARREAEEQIAAQAALLNEAQDAILLTDLDHRVLFWNRGAERLYGWSAGEAVGQLDTTLHQPESPSRAHAHARMLANGRWEGTLEQRTRAGMTLTVESRWALTRDLTGRPKSILILSTDVTERKRSEAHLLRAQRMESIGTLAGGIAHDLNNLLAPMMMSVDLLRETVTDPESVELLNTVQVSASRGAELVQQVLSFARGVEGQRVPVSPVLLVRELQRIIRDSFPKSVRVKVSQVDDVSSVLGDPTQLHQVLLNLCVNARDAMATGGELTISVEHSLVDDVFAAQNPDARPGDYAVIRVSDTGTGIRPDVRDRIFEPFFSTKEVGQGTGLGLSTSLAIVRSHGGFISLFSEAGQGTTFLVYLPANRNASNALDATAVAPQPERGNGELILVVDDEAPICRIAQRTLERFGYRVLTAGDGVEALALYRERGAEIDVVLTDMAMPVMDGPALIAALRELDPAVRVIGSSGLASVESVERLPGLPVAAFVPKPYTADVMLRAVRRALTQPAGDS